MVERSPKEGARQVMDLLTLFLMLCFVSTAARLYVKTRITKCMGIDDIFAIFALMTGLATFAFIYEGIHYSGNKHIVDVPPLALQKAMMHWKFTEMGYTLTTLFVKLSVGFLLLRIITRRWHAMIAWCAMTVAATYGIAYFIFVAVECQPMSFFWTRFTGDTSGKCIETRTFGIWTYVHGGVNIGADWTLALLPIPIVWPLQMNPRTKLAVCLLLGMGALASCAVIVRVPFVRITLADHDFTYGATNIVIWTMIEPGLGITAMNLATLRPLFRTFFSKSHLFSGRQGASPSLFRSFHRSSPLSLHPSKTSSEPSQPSSQASSNLPGTYSNQCAACFAKREKKGRPIYRGSLEGMTALELALTAKDNVTSVKVRSIHDADAHGAADVEGRGGWWQAEDVAGNGDLEIVIPTVTNSVVNVGAGLGDTLLNWRNRDIIRWSV